MTTAVAVILISAGAAFLAISAVGLVRLPDFFTRAHAVAKSETLGIMLVLGGLAVHHGIPDGGAQLLLILAFSLIANPTAIHSLARAALRVHVEPWTRRQQ